MYCVNLHGCFDTTVKAKSAKEALKKALEQEGFIATIINGKENYCVTGIATVIDVDTKVASDFYLTNIKWVE